MTSNTTMQNNTQMNEKFIRNPIRIYKVPSMQRDKDISFDEFYETLEERMFVEDGEDVEDEVQEAIDDFFNEREYIYSLNDYLFEKKMEQQGENSYEDWCSMNCSGYCADDEY